MSEGFVVFDLFFALPLGQHCVSPEMPHPCRTTAVMSCSCGFTPPGPSLSLIMCYVLLRDDFLHDLLDLSPNLCLPKNQAHRLKIHLDTPLTRPISANHEVPSQ